MADAREAMVYLDGRVLPRGEATLSVEDRGALFGDGVYEVIRYYAGRPYQLKAHQARLKRSLAGIELAEPEQLDELPAITDRLLEGNGMVEASVYWQITRGAAGARSAIFPYTARPSVLVMCYPLRPLTRGAAAARCTAALMADERWSHCWIKAVTLLPNVLARNRAKAAGHDEAILHRNGRVTEASSANVIGVFDGALRTHPLDGAILAGVTLGRTLDLARQAGIQVLERAMSVDELLEADELMLTGTSIEISAVTGVGERVIGAGEPGPVTQQLYEALVGDIFHQCPTRG